MVWLYYFGCLFSRETIIYRTCIKSELVLWTHSAFSWLVFLYHTQTIQYINPNPVSFDCRTHHSKCEKKKKLVHPGFEPGTSRYPIHCSTMPSHTTKLCGPQIWCYRGYYCNVGVNENVFWSSEFQRGVIHSISEYIIGWVAMAMPLFVPGGAALCMYSLCVWPHFVYTLNCPHL